MPAFRAAWSAGVGWIETDVQVSSDLVPVLIHDDTANRTTDLTGVIGEIPSEFFSAADAGTWFGAESAATPVPLLRELLTELPTDARVLLEIKGEHSVPALIAEIDVIESTGSDDRVFLQSFQTQALRDLRRLLPEAPLGLLVETIDDDPVALCRQLDVVSYNPDHTELRSSPQVVAQLQAAGISVVVYTADDPADWAALTELGVDGIITNDPAALLAWQQSRLTAN